MKTKILVFVGIVICAILLTSPVLASAGYSKIYGNANEDDILDMRDVTYIKLVIFGKKPTTTFADANNDGKISMLDIGQTKLIILDREKQLTLVDQADRTVTVPRPIERVVCLFPQSTRSVIEVGAADKIVGIDIHSCTYISDEYSGVFPEGKELPAVGTYSEPNTELILSLKPDVIFSYAFGPTSDIAKHIQETTDIPVVGTTWHATFDHMLEGIELVGKVLENEKEAEELISYANEETAEVTDVTEEIPEIEKPTVFFVSRLQDGTILTHGEYESVTIAGGILVTEGIGYVPQPGGTIVVSVEDFIAWDPDVILVARSGETPGTSVYDILSDPRFQTMKAVKNRRVNYTLSGFTYVCEDHPRVITEIFIMANIFHPDKFKELDIEKKGNEIFERFYGVDGLWTVLGKKCGYI